MDTVRFVVTGMGATRIAELVAETAGDRASVTSVSDFEAALAMQRGDADVYIGACQSGAGGALGVATAILGIQNVARVAGKDEVQGLVAAGIRAFGVAHSQVDQVVPMLVDAIVSQD